MSRKFSLLLVDDQMVILTVLKRALSSDAYQIFTAMSGEEALLLLQENQIDAALIDLKLPGMDGLALLEVVRKKFPAVMAIILTSHSGVKEVVKAMQLGAEDYLEKPVTREGIRTRIAQAEKIWRLRQENAELRKEIEGLFLYDQFTGNSTKMLRLKELITTVGPTQASVLIQGETGTGKELVARALHKHSLRSSGPFVVVDCGAIGESVIESELFGHVRGAFTGAHVATRGLIRSAHEGTLFLDEIGELPLAMQVKLLRVIQDGEVRPVGGDQVTLIDFRVVAATNRDLQQEIAAERFRDDLYYRLNVINIKVPPLRERKEDIPELVAHFLRKHKYSASTPSVVGLRNDTLRYLEGYEYPGNVRELENMIRRAIVLAHHADILPEDLSPELTGSSSVVPPVAELATPKGDGSLADYERIAITNALTKSGGRRRQAALILEIGEATLYRKIKQYDLSGLLGV